MNLFNSTSANRAYLASCPWHSAQIQPDGWTSDTFGPLSEIWHKEKDDKRNRENKSIGR